MRIPENQVLAVRSQLDANGMPAKRSDRVESELRVAADADIVAIVSLLNRAYRGAGSEAGWTTEADLFDGDRDNEAMLRQELACKPAIRFLIWEPERAIRGCVALEPTNEGDWYLGSFAVDPAFQNRRAGRQLLSQAEAYAFARGGLSIRISVIENRDILIAWYERRGYRKNGQTLPFPVAETRFGVPRQKGLRLVILTKRLRELPGS